MALQEVEEFMKGYWDAGSSGEFAKVAPYIGADAFFFFTEGPFFGIAEIKKAFEDTWSVIKEEKYTIDNLKWLITGEDHAVCTYWFTSDGIIDNWHRKFSGFGTNVLHKISGKWRIIHEHLSALPGKGK